MYVRKRDIRPSRVELRPDLWNAITASRVSLSLLWTSLLRRKYPTINPIDIESHPLFKIATDLWKEMYFYKHADSYCWLVTSSPILPGLIGKTTACWLNQDLIGRYTTLWQRHHAEESNLLTVVEDYTQQRVVICVWMHMVTCEPIRIGTIGSTKYG